MRVRYADYIRAMRVRYAEHIRTPPSATAQPLAEQQKSCRKKQQRCKKEERDFDSDSSYTDTYTYEDEDDDHDGQDDHYNPPGHDDDDENDDDQPFGFRTRIITMILFAMVTNIMTIPMFQPQPFDSRCQAQV